MYLFLSLDLPHPTADFPLVIFDDLNFNLCGLSGGKYVRVRANEMIEFGYNIATEPRAKVSILDILGIIQMKIRL